MYDCAKVVGKEISLIFFCSFITITTFILLNLFIMVILQNYEEHESNPESALTIFNQHIKEFRRVWKKFSFTYHGIMIAYSDIPDFVYNLGKKLGFDTRIPRENVIRTMIALQLRVDENGFVYYNDMLYTILKRAYRKKFKGNNENKLLVEREERLAVSQLSQIQKKVKKNYMNEEKKIELKGANLFFELMYTKTVFKSWKNYVQKKKKNIFQYSDSEYPGENSIELQE